MLTISSIETVRPRSNARRISFVEMSDVVLVPQQVIKQMGISVADTFDTLEDFYNSVGEFEFSCAKDRALRILTRKDCTTGEISKKLQEDTYRRDTIIAVKKYLIEYNLCDDQEYLRRNISYRLEQGIPEKKILQDLTKKHLDKDDILVVIEELSNDQSYDLQMAKGRKIIEKLDVTTPKLRDKALRKLVNRGYSFDQAKKIINSQLEE